MRRRRTAEAFDYEMILAVKRLVKPTLKFTWTKWLSVGEVSRLTGYDIETVMMLVRESSDLALHKGWRIKKAGETEKQWIPISDNPADYLIKSRSMA